MLTTGPVLLVQKVGLLSTQLYPRTQGPMLQIWNLRQKHQAIRTGAGQWRPAVPVSFPGTNVNRAKRNRFHQKIKKEASIAKAPEYRYRLRKILSP